MNNSPRHLFLTGCPRSGTTFLVQAVNIHPDIAVCSERYNVDFFEGQPKDFSPRYFDKEVVFDFLDDEGKLRDPKLMKSLEFLQWDWHLLWMQQAREKWGKAKYRGDKLLKLFAHYDFFAARIPDAQFITIIRDPYDVTWSWQERHNPQSPTVVSEKDRRWWKPRKAVHMWNDCNRLTLRAVKKGLPIHLLQYELLRMGGDRYFTALLATLGLTSDDVTQRGYYNLREGSRHVLETKRVLDDKLHAYVEKHADWDTYKELQEMTMNVLKSLKK